MTFLDDAGASQFSPGMLRHEALKSQGLRVSGRTIADATIIKARSSTKNQGKWRDPEMHGTREGYQLCSNLPGLSQNLPDSCVECQKSAFRVPQQE